MDLGLKGINALVTALRVATHAYVLDRGTVAMVGNASEIRDDPRLFQFLAP